MKIFQINTSRSRPGQELDLATANKMGASLLLVSEHNLIYTKGMKY